MCSILRPQVVFSGASDSRLVLTDRQWDPNKDLDFTEPLPGQTALNPLSKIQFCIISLHIYFLTSEHEEELQQLWHRGEIINGISVLLML